jgi:hypothetical protein
VVRSRCERSEPLAGIGILLLPSFDTPVTVNKQTNHHSSSLLIVNEETHNARQAKDLGWLHHQQRTCCCCFCLRSQAYLVCTSRALHKRADVPKHDGIVILSSSVSNRWLFAGCSGGGGGGGTGLFTQGSRSDCGIATAFVTTTIPERRRRSVFLAPAMHSLICIQGYVQCGECLVMHSLIRFP